MKKMFAILMIVLMLSALCTVALAKVEEPKEKDRKEGDTVRLIARTTAESDRENFVGKGCQVIHDVDELEDAMAIECPPGIARKLDNVEEDPIITIMDIETDIIIGAKQTWDELGLDGTGVTVAVLDTGVDRMHPELSDSISGGKSFVRYTKSYQDDNGHGTHVSGIITADGHSLGVKGVAPGAKVWMGKVCDSGGSCYMTDIVAGINYVVKYKTAKIISISLGGGGTSGSNCDYDYLAFKANAAVAKGITVVAAAGNKAGIVSSPGCGSKVISVGAVDDNDVRASFSGYGYALKIMAPGVSVNSTVPGNSYASWSGTSMATPHVSATVALLRQADPSANDGTLKNYLYSTVKDLGVEWYDPVYGYGRVQTYCAVYAAQKGQWIC